MASDLKPATFRLEQELLDRLQAHKERSGVPVSEQVRRALKLWLEEHEPETKAERLRVAPRKRS